MMAVFTSTGNMEPAHVLIAAQIGLPPAETDEIIRDTTILRAQAGALLTSLGEVLDSLQPISETVNEHYAEWIEWTQAVGDGTEPEEL